MKSRFFNFFTKTNFSKSVAPLVLVGATTVMIYDANRRMNRKEDYEQAMQEAGYDKIVSEYKEVMKCRAIPVAGANCQLEKEPFYMWKKKSSPQKEINVFYDPNYNYRPKA